MLVVRLCGGLEGGPRREGVHGPGEVGVQVLALGAEAEEEVGGDGDLKDGAGVGNECCASYCASTFSEKETIHENLLGDVMGRLNLINE